MARTEVHLKLPDGNTMMARTDLRGHGNVRVGEEFTAKEMWGFGDNHLVKGGRVLRVRVISVETVNPRFQAVSVEILKDMTPTPTKPAAELF